LENAGISNVSLAVNRRSDKANADANTGEWSRVHARLCDCSCKQTAVLIIRDADAAVALNGAAA